MINRTTEVVVIDDVKDEVEPLLNLLNKQGVGLCYYRGNLRDLPEKPIVGVRLLFWILYLAQMDNQTRTKFPL